MITVSIPKAKDITKDRLRRDRKLRDITKDVDTCTTTDQLKALTV